MEKPFASVLTTPAAVIFRTEPFPASATYRFPAVSAAIPAGPLKDAAVPAPSAAPTEPEPANVVTTPAGVILRILLLKLSTTYRFPELSDVIPKGMLNDA